ncbi:MAG: hypothetical protein FWH04_00875 [Oscillospiraceae bacterium]|nr:hypothetical protein [Oscillospiraceae bacterium]
MKTMKKLALYLLIPALLTACGTEENLYETPEELGVLYQNGETGERVAEVKRLTDEERASIPMSINVTYDGFVETRWYSRNDFASIGKISNIREMRIDYTENGERTFTYRTLFDLTVDRVYHIKDIDNQIKPGDTITINSPHSSYHVDMYTPRLHEGDEYLIFAALSSTVMGMDSSYDLTKFSDYALTSSIYTFVKKNGDYLEVPHWLDDELKEYDNQIISKQEVYGINDDNYIAAGYHLGVDKINLEVGGIRNVPSVEIREWVVSPREAVRNSQVFYDLYSEYIAEAWGTEEEIDNLPKEEKSSFPYIDNLPKDLEDMLIEKTLKKYNYTLPNKLDGKYDYKKGLAVYSWQWKNHGFTPSGVPESYLYHAEAFENTIQEKIIQYKDKDWSIENEEN